MNPLLSSSLPLAMLGPAEIVIVLLVMTVLLGLAAGVVWGVLWLARRGSGPGPWGLRGGGPPPGAAGSPSPRSEGHAAKAPAAADPGSARAPSPGPAAEPVQKAPAGEAEPGGVTSPSPGCPRCGSPVPGADGATRGLCPRCLWEAGLGTHPGAGGGHPGAPVVPGPERLSALFPQLEILELLGQGGMGVVYRARQRKLDRVVALKVLPHGTGADPAFAERFHREARALARLNHPHIVTVYDFGEVEGLFFLIMEHVDGADLRRVLQHGRLSPAEALRIVPVICDALQFAHANGVVHRDIKPANILLDREGRVKIADFGIAKLAEGPGEITLTQSRQSMGTPHYMAPEQVESPQSVDHRADIYSLGVVFYEMLTGELPIGRFAPPSRRVEVDVRLDEVVLRALEKEPERRFQAVAEVKTEVERIASSTAAQAGAEGGGDSARTDVARWLGWAAGVVSLGVVPYLFVWWGAEGPGRFHPFVELWGWVGILAPVGATALALAAAFAARIRGAPVGVLRAYLLRALGFPLLGVGGLLLLGLMASLTPLLPGVSAEPLFLAVSAGVGALLLGMVAIGIPRLARALERSADPLPRPADIALALLTLGITVVMSGVMGLALQGRLSPVRMVWVSEAEAVSPVPGPRADGGIERPGPATPPAVDDPAHGSPSERPRPPRVFELPRMTEGDAGPPWTLKASGPVLQEGPLMLGLGGVGSRQVTAVQAALGMVWMAYRECLRTNVSLSTNALGHAVVWVRPMLPTLEALENQFWTAVDPVLDANEQGFARQWLEPWFKGRWTPDRRFHNEQTLFRYGATGYLLEFWKVGSWYHWLNIQGEVVGPQAMDEITERGRAYPNRGPDLGRDAVLLEMAGLRSGAADPVP